MAFSDLFKTFSRRTDPSAKGIGPLTEAFRNRVLMRCRDVFAAASQFDEFWTQTHEKLTYLHGTPRLGANTRGEVSAAEDSIAFLKTCSDEHFLDFVELLFRVDAASRISERERLVDDFNEFLGVDDLPYRLSKLVWTKGKTRMHGREYDSMSITAYPQVIRKDSDLVQLTAVTPLLNLLTDNRFITVNEEFLEALKDYRHGKYGDCLTKCGSAFESAMKVICDARGWAYSATDTAAPLLKTIIDKAKLEAFLEQPLMLVATLRNRLSTAHGGGTQPRAVSGAKAEYAINATASAILLLVRETL